MNLDLGGIHNPLGVGSVFSNLNLNSRSAMIVEGEQSQLNLPGAEQAQLNP